MRCAECTVYNAVYRTPLQLFLRSRFHACTATKRPTRYSCLQSQFPGYPLRGIVPVTFTRPRPQLGWSSRCVDLTLTAGPSFPPATCRLVNRQRVPCGHQGCYYAQKCLRVACCCCCCGAGCKRDQPGLEPASEPTCCCPHRSSPDACK